MSRLKTGTVGVLQLLVFAGGLFTSSFCALPQAFIDSTNAIIDTLRKGECILTVTGGTESVAGKAITVKQIRNHFGFGASIEKKWFTKTDSANYGDAFRTYFEWATPENEMKWAASEELDDYQDYQSPDWLIDWCTLHGIKVRGHNLFWNEHDEWIPEWTKELDAPAFKAAMQRRINGAMTHFKGKVAHWDLINEIVHGPDHAVVRPGMLATMSGDTNVFSWVFKEARAIDPDVIMAVNEYCIMAAPSVAKEYINEINDIELDGGKIDIIGLEGHLGGSVERSSYLERIDTVAGALKQTIWLTEVDFEIDTLLRADKMEELMRTCFAHPRIGGIILWIWWEGNRWRPTYTSFLVDSNYTENELGERWRTVRDEWKTTATGTVGTDGTFNFKGFYGKYIASVDIDGTTCNDTFNLEPGIAGEPVAASVKMGNAMGTIRQNIAATTPVSLTINGVAIDFKLPRSDIGQLFLSTYGLSGRLLSRTGLSVENGRVVTSVNTPSGCRIIRVETANRVLYSGRAVQVR